MRNLRIARMVRAELNVVRVLRFRRGMSSLVSCLLTLSLNDCDFDSRPLFLVSFFLSLHIHIHVYILLLLLYTIFLGTDKTDTGLSSG